MKNGVNIEVDAEKEKLGSVAWVFGRYLGHFLSRMRWAYCVWLDWNDILWHGSEDYEMRHNRPHRLRLKFKND